MVTYAYWAAVFILTLLALGVIGVKMQAWKPAVVVALLVLAAGWGAYAFHFQQVFVKRWGGVMTLTVPDGERHIGSTWKEDNLWTESFDPATNTCHFREYSKGNLLQGRVTIKNCNPVGSGVAGR